MKKQLLAAVFLCAAAGRAYGAVVAREAVKVPSVSGKGGEYIELEMPAQLSSHQCRFLPKPLYGVTKTIVTVDSNGKTTIDHLKHGAKPSKEEIAAAAAQGIVVGFSEYCQILAQLRNQEKAPKRVEAASDEMEFGLAATTSDGQFGIEYLHDSTGSLDTLDALKKCMTFAPAPLTPAHDEVVTLRVHRDKMSELVNYFYYRSLGHRKKLLKAASEKLMELAQGTRPSDLDGARAAQDALVAASKAIEDAVAVTASPAVCGKHQWTPDDLLRSGAGRLTLDLTRVQMKPASPGYEHTGWRSLSPSEYWGYVFPGKEQGKDGSRAASAKDSQVTIDAVSRLAIYAQLQSKPQVQAQAAGDNVPHTHFRRYRSHSQS